MKAILLNLLKGFWLSKTKLLLCVLAAALSAWGISASVYSYLLAKRDFTENFTQTNPADIIIVIRNSTDNLIQKIKKNKNIGDAERREVITGRIKDSKGSWMSLVIYGVEDINHPRISKFNIVRRNGTFSDTGVYIEKSGQNFLNETSGVLTIQISGFSNTDYRIAGFIHDPGQAPAQMEQAVSIYAPIDEIKQFLPNNNVRLAIKTSITNPGINELNRVKEEIAGIVNQEGGSIVSSLIPPPGEHPHQNIVNGISFLQKSFGVILSVLGMTLLCLILITWLYPQIKNIGIMKSIGASTRMISASYFFLLVIIIGIGLLPVLWLGNRTAVSYNSLIAKIQNFSEIKSPLPFKYHLFCILLSFIIPLLFAFIPVIKGASTTVQNALSNFFYTPQKHFFRYVQGLLKSSMLRYSINNFFRSSFRTFLIIFLLASGISLFTTASNLRYSIDRDFNDYLYKAGYNVSVTLKDTFSKRMQFLGKLPFISEVGYIHKQAVVYKSPVSKSEVSTVLKTLSPDYKFDTTRLLKGRFNRNCANCLFITQKYQQEFKPIQIGSPVVLAFQNGTTQEFIFSGVIKELITHGFYSFASTPNTIYSEIAIKTKDEISSSQISKLIDDAFLENDMDYRQIVESSIWVKSFQGHLEPTYTVIQIMGISTLFIAIMGLMIILNLSMQERAKEMGILKSLGSRSTTIIGLYQREFLILFVIALVAGVVLGYQFTSVISTILGLTILKSSVPPLMDFRGVLFISTLLLLIQLLMIKIYGKYKLKVISNDLLRQI